MDSKEIRSTLFETYELLLDVQTNSLVRIIEIVA